MEVILLQRIAKLGGIGDIVKVKDGFARNFLIPQHKALRATAAAREQFEARRSEIEAQNNELKSGAETVAKRLEGLSIVIVRQASEDGKLYGSVSARDVAEQLARTGYEIDRTHVLLDSPIKNLGSTTVRIAPHPDVTVDIAVTIARSEAEAAAAAA